MSLAQSEAGTVRIMQRTPILYDTDCGFCRALLAGILVWDRERSLRPVPIQSEEGVALLTGMDEQRRLASWHLVPPGERPLSAGAALPAVFRNLPAGEPLARMFERFPNASERAYEWVADHRAPLSKLVPGALKRRADGIVSNRS